MKRPKLLLVFLAVFLALIFLSNFLIQKDSVSDSASNLNDNLYNISLLIAFIGGLLTLFAPCLVPFLFAYPAILNNSKDKTRNIFEFFLGFLIVFLLFGFSATFVGQLFIRNSRILAIVSGTFIILFSFFVLFGKGLASPLKIKRQNLHGNFFFGIAFAVGWSPCVGPILFSILFVAANSQSYFYSALLMSSYVFGIALAFLFISELIEGKRRLFVGWFSREIEFGLFGKRFFFRRMNLISAVLLFALGAFYILFGGTKMINRDFFGFWGLNYLFQNLLLSINGQLLFLLILLLAVLLFIILKSGYERSKPEI